MNEINRKPVVRLVAGAVAASAIGVATIAAVSAHADDPTPVGVEPGMTTPSYPAVVNANPASTLSNRTVYGLRDAHRVVAVPVPPGSESTKIDAEKAGIIAASQFHFVNDGGRLAEVALARVTTTNQGVEAPDGTIKPDLDHRLVWVVVFDHVWMRVGGGPKIVDAQGNTKHVPMNQGHNAVLAVYVDPETGKVFGGGQW